MEKAKLVDLLDKLKSAELTGRNQFGIFEDKHTKICTTLNCTHEEICSSSYFSNETPNDWKYVCLSLHILNLLKDETELLSVQQSKTVKANIENIVTVGILTKLQPNLPLYVATQRPPPTDIFGNYNILKCTVDALCDCLEYPTLRLLILPDGLGALLVALYQICYCPLKKPVQSTEANVMTSEIYDKLIEERATYLKLFERLRQTIHPNIYVKATMTIFYSNAPSWFKKSVSQTLTSILRAKNGVECVAVVLLDGASNDTAQTWKILEVFSKLILSCKNSPDFKQNICEQLIGILRKVTDDLIYERVYTYCTKSIYQADQETGGVFVEEIIKFFLSFTGKERKLDDGEVLTGRIKQYTRLLRGVFLDSDVACRNLPLRLLGRIIYVVFRLYALTLQSEFDSTNDELKQVLLSYLDQNPSDYFALFDGFLFGINEEKSRYRDDVTLRISNGNIVLNYSEQTVRYSVVENSECLQKLLENNTTALVKLFEFLLNCLTNKEKYFRKSNHSLLRLEAEFMNEYFERSIVVYKLLSDLADDKKIQERLTENPDHVIKYIRNVFDRTIAGDLHKTEDFDDEEFQTFFTTFMILQTLVTSSKGNVKAFRILNEPLTVIRNETTNVEVKELVGKVLEVLETGDKPMRVVVEDVKSELDKAIEDICDPLLPVRGHGLITLTKLVEKKDKAVMERKQYVLNIFEQNLKSKDSFIYLSAIGGLSAMANVFPNTVMNVLCEEYSDYCKNRDDDDEHETRMKLGEALVRVTKLLGDMAPKYKPLLLNTFLSGARDEDHLIRASSLSNLGEICRVLGYKLGTMVTEVLVCVHATITTDKAPEPRRAAVTVLRQLLAGLEKEMIAFLKEDILPIYRTLKEIYNNDKDDVMRLQAQLALEELNANMREFVFPKPELNMEKKIVMLN